MVNKKTIFWPKDRAFSFADLQKHLEKAGLDPQVTSVEVDIDVSSDGKVVAVKLRCCEESNES